MTVAEMRASVRRDNLATLGETLWWLKPREHTVWQRMARRLRRSRF